MKKRNSQAEDWKALEASARHRAEVAEAQVSKLREQLPAVLAKAVRHWSILSPLELSAATQQQLADKSSQLVEATRRHNACFGTNCCRVPYSLSQGQVRLRLLWQLRCIKGRPLTGHSSSSTKSSTFGK